MKVILLIAMFVSTSIFAQSSSSSIVVTASVLPVVRGHSHISCHSDGDTAYLNIVYNITFANTSALVSFEIFSQVEQEQYFLNDQLVQIGRMYEFGQVVRHGPRQLSQTLVVKNAPDNFCAFRGNIRIGID